MKNLKERKEALVKKLEELKTGKESENKFNFLCPENTSITIDVKGLTKEKNGITAGEFVKDDNGLALCIGWGTGEGCLLFDSTPFKKKSIWFLYEKKMVVCFQEATTLKELEKLGFTLVP